MSRQEHLAWAKQRALEYVDRADLVGAISSMISDLGKHTRLSMPPHVAAIGMSACASGSEAVRGWIDGFA
jgi:hypothetical protein